MNGVDTWPFDSRIPDTQYESVALKASDWQKRVLELADRAIDQFGNNQKLVISWLFAALIGVSGNFLANAVFATASNVNFIVVLVSSIAFVLLVMGFLRYIPAKLRLSFYWTPIDGNWQFRSSLSPPPPAARLGGTAQAKLVNLSQHLTRFATLIACGEIRDHLQRYKRRAIHVVEFASPGQSGNKLDPNFPLFRIQLQLRSAWLIMRPGIQALVRSELRDVVEGFMMAMTDYSTRGFDYDPASWETSRAISNLNGILEMSVEPAAERLQEQICA